MGIFNIFKKKNIKRERSNSVIQDTLSNNVSKEINLFNDWLDNILKEEISDKVIALNFNIYDDSDKVYLELIGSSKYDDVDINWEYQLSSKDNAYKLFDQVGEIDIMDDLVAGMVKKYEYVGKYKEKLKRFHIICNTFENSLKIIYNNRKYRKIIDYKSINVKTIEEAFSFIKDNNVIYLKKNMYEDFNYKLKGYAENVFKHDYNKLLSKSIIRNLNDIAYENSTMSPGAIISKFGYIVINTTGGGNAVCI